MQTEIFVKRISTSPYFSEYFQKVEKEKIESASKAKVLPTESSETAQVLITNTHTRVENISPVQLAATQLLIHPNSGYDNLTAAFVAKVNFPIIIGNPIRAQAVANYILSAVFSHFSQINSQAEWNKARKWPRRLINECNFLILGEGHIGSILISALKPLAKNVFIYDPYKNQNKLLLKDIDVVIPACSLNSRNQHMINKDFLTSLNDDFLLINAARGPIVKTHDLLDVLKKKPQAHAVLDVFEQEPCDFAIFSDLLNITLTSHMAGVYKNIDNVTAEFEAQVIADWINLDDGEFFKNYDHIILNNRLGADGFLI